VPYDKYKGENVMANQNTLKKSNKKKPTNQELNRMNAKHKKASHIKPVEENILYLLPIMFVVAILPLIVKLYQYSANFSQFSWFGENDIYFDFFLYYKQLFLILTAVIMSVFLFYKYKTDRNNISFPKIFIPLALYALLALLSSIISKYRRFSFTGTFEQFESVLVLLSYCILAYYSFLIIKSEHGLKLIIYALLAGAFFMVLLGLTQVSGHDFYNTDAGWSLISNSTYANSKADFPITAGEKRVYLSLFNPNYVGVYISLLFPIMLYMTIFTKNLLLKLTFLTTTLGLLVCLYGSRSTTGFISVIITVLFSLILLWRYLIKYYFFTIPIIIVSVIGLFFINTQTGNFVGTQISKLMSFQKSEPLLTDVQTNDDNLAIQYGGNTLKVVFTVDEYNICNFVFKDQTDNFVTSTMDIANGPVTISDARFPDFVFTPAMNTDGTVGFDAFFDNKSWFFTNQYGDKTYHYVNIFGKYDKIELAPSAVFTGYESYASGRGYIWSRSIPLLKDSFFLGSGADTFTIIFPQNDYVNYKAYGFEGQIMSKPHSFYLQVGVQTGVISLLAILLFYGWYFISCINLYLRCRFDNYFTITGAAIFIGTIGYMISGISNDSSLTTAPVFWVLIGIGIAINKAIKSSNEKTKNIISSYIQ
jgi:O-antigen ligase